MNYFAKIKIYYTQGVPIHQVVVPTYGKDDEDVNQNIETLLSGWENIEQYEIMKISVRPIVLHTYRLSVNLKYRNGSNRNISLQFSAETENESEALTRELINRWDNIVSFDFENIEQKN